MDVPYPKTWCDWQPVRGGMQTHALIAERYPQAQAYVVETAPRMQAVAAANWAKPWWSSSTFAWQTHRGGHAPCRQRRHAVGQYAVASGGAAYADAPGLA